MEYGSFMVPLMFVHEHTVAGEWETLDASSYQWTWAGWCASAPWAARRRWTVWKPTLPVCSRPHPLSQWSTTRKGWAAPARLCPAGVYQRRLGHLLTRRRRRLCPLRYLHEGKTAMRRSSLLTDVRRHLWLSCCRIVVLQVGKLWLTWCHWTSSREGDK